MPKCTTLTLAPVRQVTWIRHRDLHLLTVAQTTYTPDQRFVSVFNGQLGDWTLQVCIPVWLRIECVEISKIIGYGNQFTGAPAAAPRFRCVRMSGVDNAAGRLCDDVIGCWLVQTIGNIVCNMHVIIKCRRCRHDSPFEYFRTTSNRNKSSG